ncbi:FIST C-terminal domain-containing protein [Colwellia sp. E2M01]|uniref:FIST C-terminal domain-containing protein n=1 Tax=Colwellia sp. E2M01 TaxID=2841561 RepID=UPI001C07FF2A|nr:FIST C-terminal domain-containing protein [Colwellia sp. E2M01]MBU2872155.1 FIST C-terminal domain-containing protein [Colwellia sp. E2M01]
MEGSLFFWHTNSDSLADFKIGLNLAQASDATSLMVLACNQNDYPTQDLNILLKTCLLPIFGGIYPMISHQDTLMKQGALIIGFQETYNISTFSNLHQLKDEDALENYINSQLEEKLNFHSDNFLMFFDGLMNNVEDFIDCLFECLDHGITIAGGGAGHVDFVQRPCIFTNQGLRSNVVLLVTLPSKLTTSVAHGWKIFQGPFLASEVEEQTVLSLNYEPAFDLYSQAIESTSNYKFTEGNFFDIAKRYPLGIEDINSNLIIREIIVSQYGYLQCAGKIPINSMIYLLEGDIDSLIETTEQTAIDLFSKTTAESAQISMIFDCIGRVLYMEDDFARELHVINKHRTSSALFGVLSIGEIANSKSGAIRLLNKTTVISTW